ncbi:MAG: 2-C-methyl-D-erythritol 2,4-cyclodiphosphate synthase, partial [Alistipes sp.]|nr:2-C-methyl-D-erythritol 2,4-cyclodiphosphate synthase [Alistipes sp.]
QRPKLRPHIDLMRERIAEAAGIDIGQVSVKATTTEHLGFEGEERGVSATAVCLLKSF